MVPSLPCPSCTRARPDLTAPRIGHRRGRCRECNAFAQAVLRATLRQVREADPEGFEAMRSRVEVEVYAARYDATVVRSEEKVRRV